MRGRGLAPALTLTLTLTLGAAPAAQAEGALTHVLKATLVQPTTRYDHGVLGDAIEWGGLQITGLPCKACGAVTKTFTLPKTAVFEDVSARVVDLDGDGRTEVLVVETDLALGASLAVYNTTGKVTATPYIGAPHRWLAPAGVGDFDDDGHPEIAYIDRPHLTRDLVFLRYADGTLTALARLPNLTNHRIGDSQISGGVRNCGQGDELVLANPAWTAVMAARLDGAAPRMIAALNTAADLTAALACKP
ncbi:MAG: VCBS repeat-containing protein [Paracoccaceae bacterium]